ncbi:hypothetical protein GMPD_00340 [Geomonas paludis]|uniref:Uncharacterized protein n=2 Tax=Geomonas paludis TaxID=2740185 RepID=A0A6V8MPY1_9BACT|nr:hypothetical protein GMPD_00340 [Geomonas paludis]
MDPVDPMDKKVDPVDAAGSATPQCEKPPHLLKIGAVPLYENNMKNGLPIPGGPFFLVFV